MVKNANELVMQNVGNLLIVPTNKSRE